MEKRTKVPLGYSKTFAYLSAAVQFAGFFCSITTLAAGLGPSTDAINHVDECGRILAPNAAETPVFQFLTSDGFRSVPQAPRARVLELSAKKETEGLSPYEEGELRGLFAHPGSPEGGTLLQREYLSSLNIVEMGVHERERLRQIRAADWSKKQREEREFEEHGHTTRLPSPAQEGVASAIELAILNLQSKIDRISGKWNGSTKEFIRRIIESTPDDIAVFEKDSLSEMPPDVPSEIERYFLSLIDLPKFDADIRPQGALRIMESIRCLRDGIRTKKFLLGISEALRTIDSSDKSEIRVLDAGTGAIPILAIHAALLSEKVQVVALELNPHSATIAKSIVEALGLQNQITILHVDAISFQSDKQFDLVVSETMHSGLTAEPIVQIFSNIKRYLKNGGIALPSEIRVNAALVSLEDWMYPKGYVKIYGAHHHVVSSAWTEVAQYRPGDQLSEIAFDIPIQNVRGEYFVFVTTEVDIGSQRLSPYQSLITMPQAVRDLRSDPVIFDLKAGNRPKTIRVKYQPGQLLDGVSQLH